MADGRRVHRRTLTGSGARSRALVLGICALVAVALLGIVTQQPSDAVDRPAAVSAGGRAGQLTPLLNGMVPTAAVAPTAIPTQPYKNCTNTTGVPYATGLPPLPCLLFSYQKPGKAPTAWSDNGALFGDIVQQVQRSALTVPLDKAVSRIFTLLCTAPGLARPCPDTFGFQYPPADSPYRGDFFGTVGYGFLQSPLGDQPQYGTVTRKNVALMGFGALPATATLTVSQPVVDGVVEPLKLAYPSFSRTYEEGTVVPGYEKFGPAPTAAQLAGDLSISGPVVVTVSNVVLDGVPLDVGASCQAATTLQLTAQGGWFTKAPVKGEQGEYQPFRPPSFLHAGTPGVLPYSGVDVPAFTGCVGATGEDVSALVTGLASGPGNSLDLTQETAFTAYGCIAAPVPPNCAATHPDVVDPDKIVLP